MWIRQDTTSALPKGPVHPTPPPAEDGDPSQPGVGRGGEVFKMEDSFKMRLKESSAQLLLRFNSRLSTFPYTFNKPGTEDSGF